MKNPRFYRGFLFAGLANSTKMCYTYDNLNRVVLCQQRNQNGALQAEESYSYDAAGNITDAPDSCFQYDTNNRLVVFNGNTVNYDLDGNMLINGSLSCTYDSANRLVTAGGHTYTYNAEHVRIRNLCENEDTTYTYDTNCKLSQLLTKTTNGVTTKYVYGRGLIGEEVSGAFKTYHFDCRGSTIAITDATGNITDTFAYDTYGKLINKTGTSDVTFCYNGRDGVVTDDNGLIYMRARYYSPEMRRFINADIIHGEISSAITLNRFAYANGNPVSFIDPFGLIPERGSVVYDGINYPIYVPNHINTENDTDSSWHTISEITESDFSFDWLEFIAGIEFEDADETNIPISKQNQIKYGGMSIFSGLLTSAANSASTTFLTFTFQKNGNQHRVIISVGSTHVEQLYNRYATEIPESAFFANYGKGLAQMAIDNSAEKLYQDMTGNDTAWYRTYDLVATMDKRHKGSKYASYLWINSDGKIMESPIVYSNDRAQIGLRSGFLGFGFTPLMDIPINGTSPISDEYQKLFDSAIKSYGVAIKN